MDEMGASNRIIPAYAGKTHPEILVCACQWDHPCLRGENRGSDWTPGSLAGSSLLTRGKLIHCFSLSRGRGIIPAYAGKTLKARNSWLTLEDHPCLRGENSLGLISGCLPLGSSLLTRGKLVFDSLNKLLCGIIPAYAGKTDDVSLAAVFWSDHPCLRGENFSPTQPPMSRCGSSLLTRGNPHRFCCLLADDRIIPAYAGKTVHVDSSALESQDHPCLRGENRGDR